MSLSLMVTELVSTVKRPGTSTNRAWMLMDTVLSPVASQVSEATKYSSTSGIVAGIWVGVDVSISSSDYTGERTR